MSLTHSDTNLLFGMLSLNINFITRDELIEGMQACASEKSKQLSDQLVAQGSLSTEQVSLLDKLVQAHLKEHNNDPELSLAAINSSDSVREELQQLEDAELNTMLTYVPVGETEIGGDQPFTGSAGEATSGGLRYRILRPHAKGGLGEVFVAFDNELQREVALKEIQEQHADHADNRARFVYEAEINGGLEHPGIVPVYGLGQYPDGRPFYAMRFIHGDSLREAIKKFHDPSTDGETQSLELRKLLGRFIDVCNAIEYAHSRGVLHRDLKPGNIMLGQHGETLVVDWGLAKEMGRTSELTEPTEDNFLPALDSGSVPTMMGSAVGTPPYMPPEQAAGELDLLGPSSDIYSLGATLYHILTGQAPVTESDRRLLLRRVQQGDYPPPLEINPSIPPPLNAICLQSMALEQNDRYPTARELAEDIENWLADETVSSYQEKFLERLARWARRHRGWVQATAAALILITLVSIAAAFVVNAARQEEARQRQLAVAAEELAEQRRQETLQHLREAREAVDTWLTGTSDALKYYPGVQWAREQLLEKAAQNYEKFSSGQSDDLDINIERGRTGLRLGDVYRLLRKTDAALTAYRSAEKHFANLNAAHTDNPDCILELARTRTKLGLLLAELGQHDAAKEKYAAAIAPLDALKTADSPTLQIQLVLSAALINQGELLAATGYANQADQMLADATVDLEGLVTADSNDVQPILVLSTGRSSRASTLENLGRYKEAEKESRQAIAAFDRLVSREPDNPKYVEYRASARIHWATVLRALGRYRDEFKAYEAAIEDYSALTRAMPDVPQFYELLALTQIDVGQLKHHLGETGQALEVLKQAQSTLSPLVARFTQFPRYREELAACLAMLGEVQSDLEQNAEARESLETAVKIYRPLTVDFPDVLQYKERLAVALSHLGQVLHKSRDETDARAAFQSATGYLEQLIEKEPKIPAYRNELAYTLVHLGIFEQQAGRTEPSDAAYRRARQIWDELVQTSAGPEILNNLAWFLVNCANPDLRDAEAALQVAQQATQQEPTNPIYCNTLGVAYYRNGDWSPSVKTLDQARELRGTAIARDWFFLAMAKGQLGKNEEARDDYQRGLEWTQVYQPGNLELQRIQEECQQLLDITVESPTP